MKVLVVDDDLELLGLVGFALRSDGYVVVEATHGGTALQVFRQERPDLVILDINLPGLNGFQVCRALRSEAATPVLLLTVRNTEEDQVYGLDQGADDYLIKPFSPRALLARVRALLRRALAEMPTSLVAGDLRLVSEDRAVQVGDGPALHLTGREFRLLHCLIVNVGHTVPAARLTAHIWGSQDTGERQLLKQLVHRVRQKIERDPAEPQHLLTVPGVGYRLQVGTLLRGARISAVLHGAVTRGDAPHTMPS